MVATVARQEQAGIKQLSIARLRMIFEALELEDQDPCRKARADVSKNDVRLLVACISPG